MFNQYDPTVKTAINFLKLLKVKVTNNTVNETLQNHPDWPSVLSISDSLNKWKVPNAVGRIPTNDIEQLPTPFIAHLQGTESPVGIVINTTDDSVTFISADSKRKTEVTKEYFFYRWSGIYLLAEPDEYSGEHEYKKSTRKENIGSLISFATVFLLVLLPTLYIVRKLDWTNSISVNILFQYLISLFGVFITSLLLWYEMDKNNPLLKKVCTGIAKGNCEAILTGKQAKLFSWLSWSEIGFFYFSGSFLTILFSADKIINSVVLVGWLNLLCLPYIIFSVYYQWKIAKQWCVLCLAVQALLLAGGTNILSGHFLIAPTLIEQTVYIMAIGMYALPVLTWYTLKPHFLHLQEGKTTKREYLRIKFNSEIYNTLLQKQEKISIPVEGLGIKIGRPDATNTLVKVCSPFCGPCAAAHPKIEKLLEEIPNLKVQIIFTTPNDKENIGYDLVNHLLAIQEKFTDQQKITQALDDWYLSDNKEYKTFAAKYPMNGELMNQGSKIEAMDKWCVDMGIQATPTIFINGYRLPNAYDIVDLQYFLLE